MALERKEQILKRPSADRKNFFYFTWLVPGLDQDFDGIKDASSRTVEIVGRTARTIRDWKTDFVVKRGEFSPYLRGKYARPSLISQEDVRTKVSKWARGNACVRGSPNMTLASFAHNLNTNIIPKLNLPYGFPRAISVSTASRFLHNLGFRRVSANRKSVYFDGHERPDALQKRQQFLDSLFLLQTTHQPPPLPDDGLPDVAYAIGLMHDVTRARYWVARTLTCLGGKPVLSFPLPNLANRS